MSASTRTDLSEADFQRQVCDLAVLLGWDHLTVRRSIGRRGGQAGWQTTTNIKGWPDVFAWHPNRGQVAAELKTDDRSNSRPTPEQIEVLHSLRASGIRAEIWRPRDWDHLQAVLEGLDPPWLDLP